MTPDFGLLLLQYPYRPRPTGRLRNNLASACGIAATAIFVIVS